MGVLDDMDPAYLKRYGELALCAVCDRPMRPPGDSAAEWPGTVPFATEDLCKGCYRVAYADGNMSAHKALAQKEGVKQVIRKGPRGAVYNRYEKVLPRAVVAKSWSEEQRAAALQVCGRVGNAAESAEILEMLGLFDGGIRPGPGAPHQFNGPRI